MKWALDVVVISPLADLPSGVSQKSEPMEVQALMPELAIEILHEGVLLRVLLLHGNTCFVCVRVGLDEPKLHAGPLGPVEHGLAGALGPVVPCPAGVSEAICGKGG